MICSVGRRHRHGKTYFLFISIIIYFLVYPDHKKPSMTDIRYTYKHLTDY